MKACGHQCSAFLGQAIGLRPCWQGTRRTTPDAFTSKRTQCNTLRHDSPCFLVSLLPNEPPTATCFLDPPFQVTTRKNRVQNPLQSLPLLKRASTSLSPQRSRTSSLAGYRLKTLDSLIKFPDSISSRRRASASNTIW